jgi:hypothetical protein
MLAEQAVAVLGRGAGVFMVRRLSFLAPAAGAFAGLAPVSR